MGKPLMTALASHQLRLDRTTLILGIAAGITWGAVVAAALVVFTLVQCGSICLGQIIDTLALSVAAGILTIGPLALLRRRPPQFAQ
jgi:hypothetical protein